ncbi:hypothetical protein FRC02_010540 [Tulasnella sp. 418]|nr:hypothetical protein FRC02_010540 [Tulasnella sp. 418]
MALLNNWLELRSDAFKIVHHGRRPVPARTDSIGPWLDTLGFLTWLGALTNAALVFLFHSSEADAPRVDSSTSEFITEDIASSAESTLKRAILPAALIALSSSHAYLLLRVLVRHILVRAIWRGSEEDLKLIKTEKQIKKEWLQEVGDVKTKGKAIGTGLIGTDGAGEKVGYAGELSPGFWEGEDEGLADIRRVGKML